MQGSELADLQLQYENVRAPVAGVVFDPKVRPQGVLQPGERILSIVPQKGSTLRFLTQSRHRLCQSGQQAKVRVDAFPFTRYGEIPGTVSKIAADALPPDTSTNFYRFPINIDLERPYLQSVESRFL